MMHAFRLWLARWLARLAEWVAQPSPPAQPNPLQLRVKQLVNEAAGLDASGAYKKWQIVASRLQKEFPAERHADLNLLIELAVQAHAGTR